MMTLAHFRIGQNTAAVAFDCDCHDHGGDAARWHEADRLWFLPRADAHQWYLSMHAAGVGLTSEHLSAEESATADRVYAALGEIPAPVAELLDPCADGGDPFWDAARMGACDVWSAAEPHIAPTRAAHVPLPVSDDAPWRALAYAAFPRLASRAPERPAAERALMAMGWRERAARMQSA